ncbi:MAG: hypothetical protein QXZ58_08010 [Candidatus Nezhaarchaeales archaeon]
MASILKASCLSTLGFLLLYLSFLAGLDDYFPPYTFTLISLIPLSIGFHLFISTGMYATRLSFCSCPFCRVLLRSMVRIEGVEVSEGMIEEPLEKGVEKVEESVGSVGIAEVSPAPLSAPLQQVVDVEKIKESIVGEVGQLVNAKIKEFALKVEGVEGELHRVREEVGRSIEEVKNALIDVRSAIAELSNPFNILRMYPKQEGPNIKLSQAMNEYDKTLRLLVQGLASEEESRAPPLVEKPPQLEGGKVALSGLLKLVKLIDDLLTEYPKEVVVEMISSMKLLKGVEGGTVDSVLNLVNFVENAKNQGFDVVELMTRIYTFAVRLGVKDEEASEEIFNFLTRRGKRGG